MPEVETFTTADLASCAERELRMREAAYPRFVASKKMTQAKADRETRMMRAIALKLRSAADGERLI